MKEYFDRGKKVFWFEDNEIESAMEAELAKARLLPSSDSPAVDIEAFIERHLRVSIDQYAADLDDDVLGLTRFLSDGQCKISIQRKLSEQVDLEDDCPPGIRGRWRATMAHEAAHVILHRRLFPITAHQKSLFGDGPSNADDGKALLRCLARNVGMGVRSAPSEEVQANKGMAALLMPRSVFGAVARIVLTEMGITVDTLMEGASLERQFISTMATRFKVSKQAASIRLKTLNIIIHGANQTLL